MAEIEDLKIVGGSTYTVGNQDIIANDWEAGKTYLKNRSYVIREHRLYVCNVTHTSVEPFDATKWTEITVGEAIGNNTAAIGDLSTLTTTDKSSLVGAVNEVDGKIKHEVLTATTNLNGLISYDHSTKRIINAVCTSNNYVLFQIQSYVIVKHYNTFAIIANESVTFDIYYI